jgi:hypothetical protein
MQPLAPGLVLAHVMGRPAAAELLAADRQLPDQVLQPPVMRVAARLGAQIRHQVVGHILPVGKERTGAGTEEHEAGDVGRPHRVDKDLRVEGVAEPVGGQDVAAAVAQVRRCIGDRVQDALHTGPDPLEGRAATRPGRRVGRPGQVEQVPTFGLVQLQRPGKGVQHALRDPAQVAPLQAGVVVDTYPGQQGDLLPAQARHAAVAAVGGQAGLLGGDPGPPGGQELADLVAVVHGHDARSVSSPCGRPWQYLDRQGLPHRG